MSEIVYSHDEDYQPLANKALKSMGKFIIISYQNLIKRFCKEILSNRAKTLITRWNDIKDKNETPEILGKWKHYCDSMGNNLVSILFVKLQCL